MISSIRRSVVRTTGSVALVAAALSLSAPVCAGGSSTSAEGLPGEVLLKLTSTSALAAVLTNYQLGLIDQFGSRPIYRVKALDQTAVKDKVSALSLDVNVLIAEPNLVERSPEASRNNAWAIGSADAYAAQWAPQAMHLAEAHRFTLGGGVRVAVLDTGVDATHPALVGNLLPGFDFVDFDSDPDEVGSVATSSSFGHGTHVAGLIALVAPEAKIIPVRVLDQNGVGNAWVLAEGLMYAVDPDGNPGTDDGAQIINLSLGQTSRTRILGAIARLAGCDPKAVQGVGGDDNSDPGYDQDKARCGNFGGAVIVAAAGNDASSSVLQYPAAEGVAGLLGVTASNSQLRLAKFSNTGSWISIAAPGEGITSTVPGGGYGTWSGTSMATPLVAGTAALVRALNPALKLVDIAQRLRSDAAMLCNSNFHGVNAAAAVANVVPPASVCK